MTSELVLEVLKLALGVFFAILQFLLIGAIAALFKMWADQRDMKKDLNEAHKAIRCIRSTLCKHTKED